MTPRVKVTIFSITRRGVEPQFYGTFETERQADQYKRDFRRWAAKARVMIRADKEKVQCPGSQ